jgi:SAM-dependent methyltransferase
VGDGRPDSTRHLRKAYTARSPEEIAEYYDQWAVDYETHMKNVGYARPAMVAAMLSRHLPPGDAPILDAGAGTGLLADLLLAMRYSQIVGIDASPEMLALAERKRAYRELHQMILGEALRFLDDRFAAVVSAGVFTEGHAPLSGLDELIRVTRSGGYLVFSIARTYLEGPFEVKRVALARYRPAYTLSRCSERAPGGWLGAAGSPVDRPPTLQQASHASVRTTAPPAAAMTARPSPSTLMPSGPLGPEGRVAIPAPDVADVGLAHRLALGRDERLRVAL